MFRRWVSAVQNPLAMPGDTRGFSLYRCCRFSFFFIPWTGIFLQDLSQGRPHHSQLDTLDIQRAALPPGKDPGEGPSVRCGRWHRELFDLQPESDRGRGRCSCRPRCGTKGAEIRIRAGPGIGDRTERADPAPGSRVVEGRRLRSTRHHHHHHHPPERCVRRWIG